VAAPGARTAVLRVSTGAPPAGEFSVPELSQPTSTVAAASTAIQRHPSIFKSTLLAAATPQARTRGQRP
jgi:hypothetical protein